MIRDVNFLCEIGTEEIPAGYLSPAIESVKKIFTENLLEGRIGYKEMEVLATPRRIAVLISGLADAQKEEIVEIKGPSAKAAYDADGKPSKALEGFMKGNAIIPADVFTKPTDKGDYVFAKKKLESQSSVSIIPRIIEMVVRNVPFPKKMRWSNKSVAFPRPIAYFLVLFNNKVVPFELEGIRSSNKTRGHYIQHNSMIEIADAGVYVETLRKNSVIVDHRERKEQVQKELHATAKAHGYTVHEDEDLLNTVTFLVECPYAVLCDFDAGFLTIPEPVLIAEMKEHQKYFSLRDAKGKLVNRFLVISNNPPTENVKAGNERVIAARFNDARFFFNEDRKMKLAGKVDSLKNVLFHKELGSIYDKAERMIKIAGPLCDMINLDAKTKEKINRALMLCKADLNTMVVFEFPSLQGKIGKIYAGLDGEDPDVCDAIDDHYKPRFQGDQLPSNVTSVVASVAEKIDNIFGTMSVGNIPKGSHDPYALRRQSSAIIELLIQNRIALPMDELLAKVSGNYKNGKQLVDEILSFISARAKTIFTDRGFRYDVVDACLSTGRYDYHNLFLIASSIHEFRQNEKFSAMLLSFKRMNNIVTAFRKENAAYQLKFNPAMFREDAEKELHSFFDTRSEKIESHIAGGRYIELYEMLIEGKAIIDLFFDKVLVMDKDTGLRDNRLALLERILSNFKNLLDFSKLEDAK